jgi:hypothetical protein
MPSTYTPNLGLEKPATGEQAGVWGNTANNSYDFLDTATDGNLTIQLAASSYSLTTNQGAVSEGRNKVIVFTGTLTSDATITILPTSAQKLYFVRNNTTGGFNLIFQQGSGAQFILRNGQSAILYTTGTGAASSVIGAIANLQVDNLLVITSLVIAGTTTFQQAVSFTQAATFTGGVTFASPATFNSAVTVNLGGDAAYDMSYRSAGGPLVRLPIGSTGQALVVSSAGPPQWATVSMAIGGAVSGAAPNVVLFAGASSQMAQDGNFRFVSGVGLGIGIPNPGHPLHVGGAYSAELWLDNPTPTTPHRTVFAVNGVARGSIGTDAIAEGGGNTGSNLIVSSYNDPATTQNFHLVGFRNTGRTTVGAYVDLGGWLNVAAQSSAPALVVKGGGGNLQAWQDSNGNQVAYIDSSGHAFFTSSGGGTQYVTLTNNRIDLWGTIPGNPWGTIHIGPEPNTAGQGTTLHGSICIETMGGILDSIPPNCCRIFLRNNTFTIQFYYNGTQYYAQLPLVGQQGQANWTIGSVPS